MHPLNIFISIDVLVVNTTRMTPLVEQKFHCYLSFESVRIGILSHSNDLTLVYESYICV
jgi:hypothetical protein